MVSSAAVVASSSSCKPQKSCTHRSIKSLPYVISRPGKYTLTRDLSFDAQTAVDRCGKRTTVAIKVETKGVTLDGQNHWIDMQGKAGTTVLVDGVEAIQIINLNIRNSGDPGDVPLSSAVPEDALGSVLPLDISTAQPNQQFTLDVIISTYPCSFILVNAVDPYSGVGIAIHASKG